MKRLRMEDPRSGKVTYGPALGKVYGTGAGSLKEAVLFYWMYGFLWGMNNSDRLEMLAMTGSGTVTEFELEQSVAELKLKGWEDFPDSYVRAPIRIEDAQEN